MTNAESTLKWIIRHRGEPIYNFYIGELAKKIDNDIVEETLCHIWTGFYDAEPVKEVFAQQVRKKCYAVRRDRKIADNRKHYAKLCEKKGVRNYAENP